MPAACAMVRPIQSAMPASCRRDGAIVMRLGTLCNFMMPWGRRLVTGGQLGVLFDALTGEVLYQHRSPLN